MADFDRGEAMNKLLPLPVAVLIGLGFFAVTSSERVGEAEHDVAGNLDHHFPRPSPGWARYTTQRPIFAYSKSGHSGPDTVV